MPGTVAPTRPSWKNGLSGAVLARTLEATTVPGVVSPPMSTTFGPVTTAGAPSRPDAGRSLASRCFHSGMSPVGRRDRPVDLATSGRCRRCRRRGRSRRWRPSPMRSCGRPAGSAAVLTAHRISLPSFGVVGQPFGGRLAELAALDGLDRPVRVAAAVQPQVVADEDRGRVGLRRDERLLLGPRAQARPALLSSVFQVVSHGPVGVAAADEQQPVRRDRARPPACAARAASGCRQVVHSPSAPVWLSGLSTKTVSVGAPASSVPPMT